MLTEVTAYIVTTDARTYSNTISYKALRQKREEEADTPILQLFGTGYGMTKETMEKFISSEPIYGAGEYNHLSVRSGSSAIIPEQLGRRGLVDIKGRLSSGHS